MTTLLITASLDPGNTPYVALANVVDRTVCHLEALLAWLDDPSVENIVFVKNCTARIREKVLLEAAGKHGKELEFLQVESSTRTLIQGKGFGEGDLVAQALSSSRILRSSRDFIKVTGKLYSPRLRTDFTGEGYGEFYQGHGATPGGILFARKIATRFYLSERGSAMMGFLKKKGRVPWGMIAACSAGQVDTRLYRVNQEFYLRVLSNSHLRVQDSLGYILEHAFHDDLEPYAGEIRMIGHPPEIVGTSGSMGSVAGKFSESIRLEAREVASRLLT
jgi:hypothetical protein